MKRTPLFRKTPLRRRIKQRVFEKGRSEWKIPTWGRCSMCGSKGPLVRHHVVYEQHVRRAGGDPWALANTMFLGAYCHCHAQHHAQFKPIPYDKLPKDAVDFAIRLLGDRRAALYFARHYGVPRSEQP